MPLSDLSLVADMDCLKGPAGRKVGTKARQNSPERGMRRNKCGLEAKGTALRPASSHGNGHFRAKIVTRLSSLSGIGHSCLPWRASELLMSTPCGGVGRGTSLIDFSACA